MPTGSQSPEAAAEPARLRPWGKPPWTGEAVPIAALDYSRTQVAIVGGGLTGVSAAYHLARRGIRASVFEAGFFGDGASGRSGGIALEGTARGILPGTEHCLDKLRELVGAEKIDCGLHLPGCWEIEHVRSGQGDILPWRDDGLTIRVRRTVPGGIVNPLALLTGIARAEVRAGALLHERAAITKIIGGARPAAQLDGGVVRADYIVAALNAWTNVLIPEVRPVASALTIACATEPLSVSTLSELRLGPEGRPFYTVDLPYLWGRMLGQGQIIFGAGLVFGAAPELEKVELAHDEPSEALKRLKARVRALHPALSRVRFAAQWAGPVAIAENFAPFIGRLPGAPSVIAVGGYSGHGVALSVWMGEAIARAIAEGAPLPQWGTLKV